MDNLSPAPAAATEPLRRSFFAKMMQAKASMPMKRQRIFSAIYERGQSIAETALELGLPQAEIELEHRQMLRSLRGASALA